MNKSFIGNTGNLKSDLLVPETVYCSVNLEAVADYAGIGQEIMTDPDNIWEKISMVNFRDASEL